jgi:5'-AMP-activated protein kinase catalytic alpha subunit
MSDTGESRREVNNVGSYILGVCLGEGAFGKVKVATHIHTGEKVAIKILDKSKMQEDPDDIVRVQNEIAILKKMRHKNIIQLYEIMESTKNIYLVMEYCEGKELFEYIVMKKRLSEAETLKFYQEIMESVEYLHKQNIAHRDLKPENLLLDYKFSIKVSDFGLSCVYEDLLSTPCGTPSYAPPEMLSDDNEFHQYHGLLSDIWSAGIILYAMVCGYLPFSEDDEEENRKKIIAGDYEIPDWVSDSLADLIRNVLQVDPLQRFDLDQIKEHPWFQSNSPKLKPGILIGYHKIPIDENILSLVDNYGYNKEKTRVSLMNNKFDTTTAIYYLCLRKFLKDGGQSFADLESDLYLEYINSETCLVNPPTVENQVVTIVENGSHIDEEKNEANNAEEIKSEHSEYKQANESLKNEETKLNDSSKDSSNSVNETKKTEENLESITDMLQTIVKVNNRRSSVMSERLSLRLAGKYTVFAQKLEFTPQRDFVESNKKVVPLLFNPEDKDKNLVNKFRRNSLACSNPNIELEKEKILKNNNNRRKSTEIEVDVRKNIMETILKSMNNEPVDLEEISENNTLFLEDQIKKLAGNEIPNRKKSNTVSERKTKSKDNSKRPSTSSRNSHEKTKIQSSIINIREKSNNKKVVRFPAEEEKEKIKPSKKNSINKPNNKNTDNNIKDQHIRKVSKSKKDKINRDNKFSNKIDLARIDSSIEKSKSKTPIRNLSYSPDTLMKSKKQRVGVLPWKIKKKVIDAFPFTKESNKLKILSNYEEFKKQEQEKTKKLHRIKVKKLNKESKYKTNEETPNKPDLISQYKPNLYDDSCRKSMNSPLSNMINTASYHKSLSIEANFSEGLRNNMHLFMSNQFNTNTIDSKDIFSTRTTKRRFDVDVKRHEHLKIHSGPVDISSLVYSSLSVIIERINQVLNRKKIVFIRTNPYKFRCSKNGMSFDIEVFKLENFEEFFYLKFRIFQGEDSDFKKMIQYILKEF